MTKFIVAAFVWLASCVAVYAQSAPVRYLSLATTNSKLILGERGLIESLLPVNSTGTQVFLKLYDKATAPVCGTDTPVWTVPVPANNAFSVPLGQGLLFANGIGLCITNLIADSDTTVVTTGIAINLGVSGR
jgi:hypothetical protein